VDPIATGVGPGELRVDEVGDGPRVVLVHGGGAPGFGAFETQLPLADRWHLVAPHRLGYEGSPDVDEDWSKDAPLIAELLDQGAHLLGASYGGTVAMLAAQQRPGAVRSLTLVEPAAISLALDDPVVAAFDRDTRAALTGSPGPAETLTRLFGLIEPSTTWPDPLPDELVEVGRRLQRSRPPQDAAFDVEALRCTGFPIVVITGGARKPFEAIARAIERQLDGRHVLVVGARHGCQHDDRFNRIVEDVWQDAEAAAAR